MQVLFFGFPKVKKSAQGRRIKQEQGSTHDTSQSKFSAWWVEKTTVKIPRVRTVIGKCLGMAGKLPVCYSEAVLNCSLFKVAVCYFHQAAVFCFFPLSLCGINKILVLSDCEFNIKCHWHHSTKHWHPYIRLAKSYNWAGIRIAVGIPVTNLPHKN